MSIEAMKQALEALENASEYIQAEHDQRKEMYEPYGMVHKYSTEAQNLLDNKQAITSLRQAIEQAEKQEPFGWVSQHTVKGPYEWQFNKELSGVYRDNAISILPLYTTPPQRECEGCDKMAKP